MDSPIGVENVDGSPNGIGTIRHYTYVKVMLDDHPFYILAYVANLAEDKLILGDPWLQEANPIIDWAHKKVHFTRRPYPKLHPSKSAMRLFMFEHNRRYPNDTPLVFCRKPRRRLPSSQNFGERR